MRFLFLAITHGIFVISVFFFFFPGKTLAVFNEQILVDARAIGLANTCTADPPGLMSVHYNPAGLSLLNEGKTFSNGLLLPFIKRTGRFKTADDFDGFMNGTWGPDPDRWPDGWTQEDDPDSDHGGPDPLDGTSGTNSSGRMYIPFYGPVDFLLGSNLGLSSRKTDSKWTFAYANYVPYGGGMSHRDEGDPLRFGTKSMYAQHLVYAAPSASYELSDQLSLGVSIGMAQRAMGMEMDIRSPNELVALTRVIGDATRNLEVPVVSEQTLPPPFLGGGLGPYEHNVSISMDLRDDFAPSFNLGLLWRPRTWFSYGICYQSESKAEMTGKYLLEYSEQFQRQVAWNAKTPMTMQGAGMLDLPSNPVPYQRGTATTIQTLPTRVQTGIMVRPMERLKLLFDVHYANWAAAEKETRILLDQRIQILRIAKMTGYTHDAYTLVVDRYLKDSWHWSVAMEYVLTSKITLRCGYEKRPTSVPHDHFDVSYFIPDADFVGAGIGINMANGTVLDLGLGYLWSNHFTVYNNESTNLNSTDFTQMGNPYAGLDYEQDMSIAAVSMKMTMPLEVQVEKMRHQVQMLKKGIHKVKELFLKLNPFKDGPEELNGDEYEEKGKTQSGSGIDPEELEFDLYLERLSEEYDK